MAPDTRTTIVPSGLSWRFDLPDTFRRMSAFEVCSRFHPHFRPSATIEAVSVMPRLAQGVEGRLFGQHNGVIDHQYPHPVRADFP